MKKETTTKRKSLYLLASNKPGKKFTFEEYDLLTGKEYRKARYELILNNGESLKYDSVQERRIVRKLEYYDAFKYLRTQCIVIEYKYAGKIHKYYPDFVVYTKTGKIIIIEVKNITEMKERKNRKKYLALDRYCKKNGYLYIVMNDKLKTLSNLSTYSVSYKASNAIEEALFKRKAFTYKDFQELTKDMTYKERNKIQNQVSIYVDKHADDLKQVGDLIHHTSIFRIAIKKKKS